MKNFVIILVALFTINVSAQEREENRKKRQHNYTPGQIATLKTKKMTLHLNLSEAQQKAVYGLNLKQAQKRKSKLEERKAQKHTKERRELSQEEKFELLNERLDVQIAHKKSMQSILNTAQFEKWEKVQTQMKSSRKRAMKRKGAHKRQ